MIDIWELAEYNTYQANQRRKVMAKKKQKQTTQNNLVAKHARAFNKAAVHKDRKKAQKKGYRKHKNTAYPIAA